MLSYFQRTERDFYSSVELVTDFSWDFRFGMLACLGLTSFTNSSASIFFSLVSLYGVLYFFIGSFFSSAFAPKKTTLKCSGLASGRSER